MTRFLTQRVACVAVASALALCGTARGDVLLTTDGRLLDGVGRLEGGAVVFVQRTGPNVRVELSRIALWSRGPARLLQGVRLRTGEVVAGEVVRLGERGLVVRPPGWEGSEAGGMQLHWPVSRLAEIVLDGERLPRGGLAGLPGSGVLLAGGDFVEGELTQLTGGHIVVSSVLFGERSFGRPGPAVAIRLDAEGPVGTVPKAGWRVTLADGTVAFAERLLAGEQGARLRVTDAAGRVIQAETAEISEVRLPGAMGPVDGARVRGVGSLPSGLAARVRGVAPWAETSAGHGVVSEQGGREGGRLEVEVAGADAMFFRLGLAEGLMPNVRGRFVIEVDGERVARTGWMGSIDEPVRVGVRVAGKSRLVVRLEGEEGAPVAPEGVVADLVGVTAP